MGKQYLWEVDEATSVEASFGAFGRMTATVNGVAGGRKLKSGKATELALPNGQTAVLRVIKKFVGTPQVDLSVDGKRLLATPKEGLFCPACKHSVHGYDSFCDACGKPLPTAQDQQHKTQVVEATKVITVLGVIYLVFGIIMYFVSKGRVAHLLSELAVMDPDARLPKAVNGKFYSVAELRAQVHWEVWSVLITNLVLAATMGILALWSRRTPLGALLVAAAVYAAVNVLNAIVDPATIFQGIIMKAVIIAYLVHGIRSALALRTANG
jgi:hypothetical protein